VSTPAPRDRLVRRLGAILWPSFFSAGVCTMVFFAFVDPLELNELTFPQLPVGRELGYSIGFFLFWLGTASSSLFTWLLLRRRIARPAGFPPPADSSEDGEEEPCDCD
jgi:hypothetical protein